MEVNGGAVAQSVCLRLGMPQSQGSGWRSIRFLLMYVAELDVGFEQWARVRGPMAITSVDSTKCM